MTAIVLALLCAIAYGTSDFIGGVMSSRIPPWTAALCSQAGGSAALAIAALIYGGGLSIAEAGWGALAGAGSGLGCAFLYRGLAAGRMGVVAPISGVGAAVVPVLVGLAAGERPAALVWVGIVLAMPAIYLVARTPAGHVGSAGVLDGVLAGLGFGGSFAAVAQLPGNAGLWPFSLGQLVAAVVVAVGATALRQSWLPRSILAVPAAAAGLLGATALVLFWSASTRGFLTVTAVIAALYPAATVLLAGAVLRERVHRLQACGLALCAAAVVLVAAG